MILARVIVAATLVLAELWSVLAIFAVGFDSRRGNRRLRWITGDDAETVRDRHSLMAQLSMMGIVNTVAGAAAGLGASMYAANNHLQFTQSVAPIFMIGMAVLAVQASGLVVGHWASRPRLAWITNPFVLEATLRQSLREGPVPDHTIDGYEQILEKLRSETSVLFLKKADTLETLGIASSAAAREWPPSGNRPPEEWAKLVRADLSPRAVWRWIWARRKLALVCPLSLGVLASAALVGLRAIAADGASPVAVIAVAVVLCGWHVLLGLLMHRAATEELVLANRTRAREKHKIDACAALICELKAGSKPRPKATEQPPARTILSVGRWHLLRR